MKTPIRILILLLLPLYLFSFSNHRENKPHYKDSALERFLDSTENYLAYIYEGVNQTARFVDETVTKERSKFTYKDSYVHFQSYYETYSHSKSDQGVDLKVKIRLPNFKEKFRLILSNDDNKVAKEEFNDSIETVEYKDDKYNVALQYASLKKEFNIKTKAGIKVSENPYAFIKASASKKYQINKKWYFEPKETLEYSTRDGLENTTELNFHKIVNKRLHFVNHNEYYWNEEDRIDYIYNSLRVNQVYSDFNILNYVTSVSSDNGDSQLETRNYTFYISYKHYIRKWLYYDIVPRVYWERENNFHDYYALRLNLGIMIGK